VDKPNNELKQNALTRPALPHYGDRFPAMNFERYVPQHRPLERDGYMLDAKYRCAIRASWLDLM
jgi:hypothetical protein